MQESCKKHIIFASVLRETYHSCKKYIIILFVQQNVLFEDFLRVFQRTFQDVAIEVSICSSCKWYSNWKYFPNLIKRFLKVLKSYINNRGRMITFYIFDSVTLFLIECLRRKILQRCCASYLLLFSIGKDFKKELKPIFIQSHYYWN